MKFQRCFHKEFPMTSILNEFQLIHHLDAYLFLIHPNIFLLLFLES